MEVLVKKSIAKVMCKLVGFSLKRPLLGLSCDFKLNTHVSDAIWITSERVRCLPSNWASGNFLEIILIPKTKSQIKEFESEIESIMAYLHNENLKLEKE